MSQGTLISADTGFPTVRVYEREESFGKIYTIVFRNLEPLSGWERLLLVLVVIAVMFLAGPYGLLIFFGLLLSPIIFGDSPLRRNKDREIELDYGCDTFRVLLEGKQELERPLSQLKSVTVDQHPDTNLERENRRQQKREGPGILEKTHCLFGWFGWGGAEQVILVSRLEWPSRNSLREVREAIEWIRSEVAPAATGNHSTDDGWD